ncbi:hypothetical protein JTB14_000450 [Gonioctena quinquepunctata]|nr:hypothetical protein JTB14_000450 [Gonioctena quinquepunctata]
MSSNENQNSDAEILKKLYMKYHQPSPKKKTLMVVSDSDEEIDDHLNCNSEAKKSPLEEGADMGNTKETKKISKNVKKKTTEEHKALKQLERSNKQVLMKAEKVSKDMARKNQKSLRPEECIKNILVKMDESILLEEYGESIKANLRNNGISYKSTSSLSGIISWTRKTQTIENMFANESEVDEKHYFLIIPSNKFTKLVRENSLINHIQHIHENIQFHHLSIAVFGKEKPSEDEEYAVMEVEMFFKCYWQFVKKSEDLASFVMMVTKSIAQIPYKLQQQEKYELQSQFFDVVNKDTVRVDKHGNGLGRAWRQMLTMFPLARLETAEAITAAFSTPTSLFEAYRSSTKPEELIQNLPIRRAQGPLTSVRKIGPELSKKCFNFFTSEDNILL